MLWCKNVMAGLPCWLWKGSLKQHFLDIFQTTFSKSVISEIQNLWGSSFFSKCSKFNLDFKKAEKHQENFFWFWDNSIWIGIVKLSLLITRYLSLAVNMSANNHKIWDITKRDLLQHNCLHSDQWIWKRCFDGDFKCFWARLPCCSSKRHLKGDVLDIYRTTFSESKQKNIKKKFFVSEIIASELVSLICHSLEQDTCHRQSIW